MSKTAEELYQRSLSINFDRKTGCQYAATACDIAYQLWQETLEKEEK